jgi:hypothetical protein
MNELTVSLGLETENWTEGLDLAKAQMSSFISEIESQKVNFDVIFSGIDQTLEGVKQEVKTAMDTTIKELGVFFDSESTAVVDPTSKEVFESTKLDPLLTEEFKGQQIKLTETTFDLKDVNVQEIERQMSEAIKPKITIDSESVATMAEQIDSITQPSLRIMEKVDSSMENLNQSIRDYKTVDIGGDIEKLSNIVTSLNQTVMKLVDDLDV